MLHGAQKGSAVPLILPPHFMAIRHCADTCAMPAVFPGGIPALVSFGGQAFALRSSVLSMVLFSPVLCFLRFELCLQEHIPSPTGLFLLQMRLLRKSPGRAGQKNCTERPLHFSLASTTINKQRVAFLRKSGCRNAARFFCECAKASSANRAAEMRKSGFCGSAHFLCFEGEENGMNTGNRFLGTERIGRLMRQLPILAGRFSPAYTRRYAGMGITICCVKGKTVLK